MLKLKLPGAKNNFFIEDVSSSCLIEQELSCSFYPYAASTVPENADVQGFDLWMSTDGKTLEIKTASKKVATLLFDTSEAVYKKIVSLIRENLLSEPNYCYLHGSAVSIMGETCLFLAETGTGKTTLSVFWDMQKDKRCLSDDLIILNKDTFELYPISSNAHVRQSSSFLLGRRINALRYNELIGRYEYPLEQERFSQKHFAKYIFVLQRKAGKPRIEPCEVPVHTVLENMFLPYQMTNNIVSAMKISQQFTVYNLFYEDLGATSELLEKFIRERNR